MNKIRTSQELLFNGDSLGDDPLDSLGMRPLPEVTEEQASEVGVHALVAGNKLVGEGETRHETPLLEPEDGSERAREEDTLNGSESNETFGECRAAVGDPLQSPVSLALDTRNVLNSIKEVFALGRVLNVGVDE
jgi:hypothetical protein